MKRKEWLKCSLLTWPSVTSAVTSKFLMIWWYDKAAIPTAIFHHLWEVFAMPENQNEDDCLEDSSRNTITERTTNISMSFFFFFFLTALSDRNREFPLAVSLYVLKILKVIFIYTSNTCTEKRTMILKRKVPTVRW